MCYTYERKEKKQEAMREERHVKRVVFWNRVLCEIYELPCVKEEGAVRDL